MAKIKTHWQSLPKITKDAVDILPALKDGDSKTIKHFHVQQS